MKAKAGWIAIIIFLSFILGIGIGQSYPPSPVSPPTSSNTNITTNRIVVPDWIEVEQLNASWVKTPMPAEATFVVAASNSINKEHANYICDGIADDVEINYAIENCTNGGVVLLMDGLYNISSPINITENNITLKMSKGAKIRATDNIIMFRVINVNNVKIEGGMINCSAITSPPTFYAMYFLNTENSTLRDVVIINNAGDPEPIVYFKNGKYNVISHCKVYSNGGNTAIKMELENHSKIFDCIVYNSWNGIWINGSNVSVTNCFVENCRFGIEIDESFCMVQNNKAIKNYYGIYVKGRQQLCSGNMVVNSSREGIYVAAYNSSIVGNFVFGSSKSPSNTYANILLYNSFNCTVLNNVCRSGGTAKYGIYINGGKDNWVTNNDLRYSGLTANLQDNGTNTITTAGNQN